MSDSSDHDVRYSPTGEKINGDGQLEVIRTISRVPGNSNYYEKNGLRTEGDGVDHSAPNKISLSFVLTVTGAAIGLAASQIYPLLYLTVATPIATALGHPELYIWMLTAGILAMGAVAPFVGPLSDLLGRKKIFLFGFVCGILGSIVCAATPNAAGFIAGQVFLGLGAVICELIAIAVIAEVVPTEKRAIWAVVALSAIIPWAPGTLYANYMLDSTWRWIGLALGLWNAIGFAAVLFGYNPPARVNARGLSKREMIKRIDFVGGGLIIAGLLIFLYGLNSGGISHPWKSSHVLVPIILGPCLMIAAGLYEFFLAPYPLFPRRIIHDARPFFCMLAVIFAAGINYIPLVSFWPIETIAIFQSTHAQVGVRCIVIGVCILGGAMVSAVLLGLFKKHVHFVMLGFCIMQTAACACLVLIRPDNIKTAWAPLVFALFGVGGVLVPNQVIITVITPDDLIGSVTALTVGLRAQAQVVGLAIFYNQLINQVTKSTYKYVVPAWLSNVPVTGTTVADITFTMNTLSALPFDTLAREYPSFGLNTAKAMEFVKPACIHAFDDGFKLVWYITIAFGVFACIASACMGSVSKYLDGHVAVRMDEKAVKPPPRSRPESISMA
ncbi:hypothetical protein LTR95_015990 [Oleoguttula sp. CCFEE 5521]